MVTDPSGVKTSENFKKLEINLQVTKEQKKVKKASTNKGRDERNI